MNQSNYYVANAANPIELAELNVPFFSAFVQEMGCNRLYRELWVGENLSAFIQNFRQYKTENETMKARKEMVISQYEIIYRQFTRSKY